MMNLVDEQKKRSYIVWVGLDGALLRSSESIGLGFLPWLGHSVVFEFIECIYRRIMLRRPVGLRCRTTRDRWRSENFEKSEKKTTRAFMSAYEDSEVSA